MDCYRFRFGEWFAQGRRRRAPEGIGWRRRRGQRWQTDASAHCSQRKTVAHAENLLCSQSSARCLDEGAAGRNDRTLTESHQGMVPEQEMQGQKKDHTHEAADATGKG